MTLLMSQEKSYPYMNQFCKDAVSVTLTKPFNREIVRTNIGELLQTSDITLVVASSCFC